MWRDWKSPKSNIHVLLLKSFSLSCSFLLTHLDFSLLSSHSLPTSLSLIPVPLSPIPHCLLCQVAARLGLRPDAVKNGIVWGNHSSTQFPDVAHGYVVAADGSKQSIYDAVKDDAWLKGDFIKVNPSLLYCLYGWVWLKFVLVIKGCSP